MMSKVLFFLGFVLIVIPIWVTTTYDSNLAKQSLEKPKGYDQFKFSFKAIEILGAYWVLCGIVLKFIDESFLIGIRGTIIFSSIFLLPMVMMAVIGSSKKGSRG